MKAAVPRVILLTPSRSYRAVPFLAAAKMLGIEVTRGIDIDPRLSPASGSTLPLDYADVDDSVRKIVAFAAGHPVRTVLPVDDAGTVIAAKASARLGLPGSPPDAAIASRDKHRMRQVLEAAGLPTPPYRLASTVDDPAELAASIPYPCVVKPLLLSGSRGVIRADGPGEFVSAFRRSAAIVAAAAASGEPILLPAGLLIEGFIPGSEVALEGILTRGELAVLALFDKPDPLDGPYFEETIYVTPSRLPAETQSAIEGAAQAAAAALGLREGPIHTELRVNEAGPWMLEIAARSIGGLCSRVLSFGLGTSLEELILRHACGLPVGLQRGVGSAGVMMIPIPERAVLAEVQGVEAAAAVTGITEVSISARPGELLVPLPEAASYLGFIFAKRDNPDAVEASLRRAHAQLRVVTTPEIRVFGRPPVAP